MKTFIAATFAALLLLSFLAWRTKPAPVDPAKTQLVWTSDDNPLRREQIDPFNALHPQYHLELDPNNADPEKVVVQSLAGVGPDLFDCFNGFHLTAFVKAGIAWDVTDELRRMNIDVEKECWPSVKPTAIFEGRAYGFPTNTAANGLWYHKDMLADAGVTIPRGPWTWEEAVPLLRKLV